MSQRAKANQASTVLPSTLTDGKEARPKKRKVSKKEEADNSTFQAHNNILRDQIPIKYKSSLYYE